MKYLILNFLLFLLVTNYSLAQDKYSTESKKAIKHYEKAQIAYKQRAMKDVFDELNYALKIDSNFTECWIMYSEIFLDKNDLPNLIKCYNQIVRISPERFPVIWMAKGTTELEIGKYDLAKTSFQKFLSFDKYKKKYDSLVNMRIQMCDFGMYQMAHPVDFKPNNLGKNVNSKHHEYWPSLTVDEQLLIFTRLIPIDSNLNEIQGNRQEDFYLSKNIDSTWSLAENMGAPANTRNNEGAQTISADGKTLVFTACNRDDGLGRCDLYYSFLFNEKWTTPRNLGIPINTPDWESQPSLSSDGKTLYFVSNRKGGKGGFDIWKSTLNTKNQWSLPENLGHSINTKNDEESPFIHPDNQTLYFGSKGWMGMGGADIFMSRKINDSLWQTAKNLGYPINTYKDEKGMIVNTSGTTAYYSSDRENSLGGIDIFQFEIPNEIRPYAVTYLKGTVMETKTKKRLGAFFQLYDLETNTLLVESNSDIKNGTFMLCLPSGKNYMLNVSRDGYLFYSENFALENKKREASSLKPFLIDVFLQPMEKGSITVLRNVFFETDKYVLKPESKTELDKLVDFLIKNPKIKIELRGHTDNQGSEEHNLELSKNRAKSVLDYLVTHKIDTKRLSYNGYGFSLPIATNDTPEGRYLNRRTEFKILE